MLKRLETKGFIISDREGKFNTYTPLVLEKDYLEELKQFIEEAK